MTILNKPERVFLRCYANKLLGTIKIGLLRNITIFDFFF